MDDVRLAALKVPREQLSKKKNLVNLKTPIMIQVIDLGSDTIPV